jgi:hypothetical protein
MISIAGKRRNMYPGTLDLVFDRRDSGVIQFVGIQAELHAGEALGPCELQIRVRVGTQ